MLNVRHLTTRYLAPSTTSSDDGTALVNDVSFSIAKGEILGLVGESGSGKSMTAYSIMGLLDPPARVTAGEILLTDRDRSTWDLARLDARTLRSLRGNRIAMVFQDPSTALNPVLRVDTQMIEALQAHASISKSAARERASAMLGRMGIAEPGARLQAYPHQLSGGMRQRVAIAIALLNRPDVIIADEPTTALDVSIQGQILAEIQALCREAGTALLWITHDLSVVAGLADRICVMYAGRIIESGSVEEVLIDPRHPYTAGLIASSPAHSSTVAPQPIPGAPPSLATLPPGCAFAPRCTRATSACLSPQSNTSSPTGREWRCIHPLSQQGGEHAQR
jgi:peptide/nickel transport system ATP-binding protein